MIEPLETDPTWKRLGTGFSCVIPATHEPDPAIVRAIREFDPEYVPMWCVKEYRTDSGGIVQLGYHVIGRHILRPWEDPAATGRDPLHVLRPTSEFPFPGPIFEQRTWAYDPTPGTMAWRWGWPALYQPIDWDLVEWMRCMHYDLMRARWNFSSRRRAKDLEERYESRRALEKVQSNAKENLRSDRHMVRRAIERELFDDGPPPDPKPYVFHGAPS